ncbi:MAG: alkaline phosphatase family protein [Candidatus Tumulicola sp.]
MHRRNFPRHRFWAAVALVTFVATVLPACGGSSGGAAGSGPLPSLPPPTKGKYFTHIVIVVQENRTFDNLFSTFPGADGTRTGKLHDGSSMPLQEHDLYDPISPNTDHASWLTGYNDGRMNGFDLIPDGPNPGTALYQYVNPAQIQPYWTLAKQYVLADHMFQTQGTGSFTAHQDLIAGGAMISASKSLIDFPTLPPWGCDAPSGTLTTLITANNQYLANDGPFPCLRYRTLRDTLDAKAVTWRYYAPEIGHSFGGDLWNAFGAIDAVRHGPEWSTNVTWPETNVFRDISHDTLPSVAWVIPDFQNSDHPGAVSDTGPSWVAQVVNTIGQSPAWNSTAIVIVWDDWGGWFDHVRPPGDLRYGGLGFRVPMIVVSPFSKHAYVAHNSYEFGSIVQFVEDNWGLPRLGTTDVRAASFIDDVFDFKQRPRTFAPVDARYSRSFFERQQPSNLPVDNE